MLAIFRRGTRAAGAHYQGIIAHGFVEHVTANRIKNDIHATVAG